MEQAFRSWIDGLTEAALSRRRDRLAALKTPADVAAWAAELRAWYRQRVGPMVPLAGEPHREHCGTVEREGYRVEKWLFEVMPGTLSSANLYVPARPNARGVSMVAPLGHWGTGKWNPSYMNLGGYMASNGVPVLVYDHAGCGERREFWDRVRGESIPGPTPTSEHDRTGDMATLAGVQPSRFYLTEAVRAREFLATFEYVEPTLIGVTGCSGGGTLSRMAAAYVDEWAFSVPVCIIRGDDSIGGGDAEQCTWGAGDRGVVAVDLLATMAPRPAMIVTETAFERPQRAVDALRRVYEVAGAPDACDYFAIDDEHGYTHPMIEAVYRFLARQFDLSPAAPNTWHTVRPMTEPETWCGTSGILDRDRVQVGLLEQIDRLVSAPTGLTRATLADVLRIGDWDRAPVAYTCDGGVGESVRVTGATTAGEGDLGVMDFADLHPPDWHSRRSYLYRSVESNTARLLLHFDRYMVGLRVRQILDFLADHKGQVRELRGDRQWSVPVALACALAGPDLLAKATVTYLPASLRAMITADPNSTPLAMIVPGLVQYGDMDDVIGLCGGRLTVHHRVDADGRVVA